MKKTQIKDKLMHHLSSKVAISVTRKDRLPYQKREFPLLSEMCLQQLAIHFDKYPTLEGLSQYHKEIIFDNLGVDFPIIKLAKHVDYEPYWKNACDKKWNMLKLPPGHTTWKSAFFTRYLQEYIENLEDVESNYFELIELLKTMAHSVYRLRIDKVKVEFDLNDSLGKLVNLKYLRLSLVKKDARSNFTPKNLGMTMTDINNIAQLLPSLKELETFELVCDQLDDDGIQIMIKSLEDHPKLHNLSLSHNKISNVGARRVSRIFNKNKRIKAIDLSNNQIGYEGARCLSLVLAEPVCQLQSLNLSLNLIGDKAFSVFLADIVGNRSLLELDLSGNLLTDESMADVVNFLNTNKTLNSLKLNCNRFSKAIFDELKRCLLANKSLEVFEIHTNEIGVDQETELAEIIIKKKLERKGISFVSTKGLLSYLDNNQKAKEAKEKQANPVEAGKEAPTEQKPGEEVAKPETDDKNEMNEGGSKDA